MTSGEDGWTLRIRTTWHRRRAILTLGLLACTLGCVATPTDSGDSDRNTTSCPPDIFGGSPSPSLRGIIPDLAVAYVEGSRVDVSSLSAEMRACFFRDRVRSADQAAIGWSVTDTSIATVAPTTGAVTRVFGRRFGRTTLTAVITGVPVSVPVLVCLDMFTCPA